MGNARDVNYVGSSRDLTSPGPLHLRGINTTWIRPPRRAEQKARRFFKSFFRRCNPEKKFFVFEGSTEQGTKNTSVWGKKLIRTANRN